MAVVVAFRCHCRKAYKKNGGQWKMQQQRLRLRKRQQKRPHQTPQTIRLEFVAAEPTDANAAAVEADAAVDGNRDDNSSTKTKRTTSSLRPPSIGNDSAPPFRSSSFVGRFCKYNSLEINSRQHRCQEVFFLNHNRPVIQLPPNF